MTKPTINFIDNPAAKNGFTEITIDCAKALKSWKDSVYSYEWLNSDGKIKSAAQLSATEQEKRLHAEKEIEMGKPLCKPILGIGIMDNIEIGSGRAELLTLIDQGHKTLPVHIPTSQEKHFKPFLCTEKGNAIFYVLIAISLLAALSFTIAQSTQSSGGDISKERASLIATEIVETSNAVAQAVAKLRLNGCLDTQISFETANLTNHVNANAPNDESCHVFSLSGGGLTYQDVNTTASADGSATWQYTGDLEVQDSGTSCAGDDCADLLVLAKGLTEKICTQLNKLSGLGTLSIPAQTLTAPTNFEGSYDYVDTIGDQVGSPLAGQRSGCFENTTAGNYVFYRTLVQR